MKQREIQDEENTTWTCVRALSGLRGQAGAEAAERVEERRGHCAGRLHAQRRPRSAIKPRPKVHSGG
jgi:hypothetical protein